MQEYSSQNDKHLISSINANSQFPISGNQQQQSQYLNRHLLSLIQASTQKNIQSLQQNSKQQSFLDKQLIQSDLITSMGINFRKCCPNSQGIMDYVHFRKMLGLLGRQDSFISRIFHLIDQNSNGVIGIDEYTKYMMRTLFGNQDQKAYNAWRILIGKRRGQSSKRDLGLQLYDFMEIFDQLTQLWNSLTDQVIPVNKKYVEELFNIFDLDQDQIITFSDYRIFYEEHPHLFGWFQYLNGISIDQKKAANQLIKLRQKLTQGKKVYNQMSLQQIKDKLITKKSLLQKGVKNIFEKLQDTKNISQRQSLKYLELSKIQSTFHMNNSHIEKVDDSFKFQKSKNIKINKNYGNSNRNGNQTNNFSNFSQSISANYLNNSQYFSATNMPSKYVYSKLLQNMKTNHILNYQQYQSQSKMSKIHQRKTRHLRDSKVQIKNQLIKQLKGFLDITQGLIQKCHQYRQLHDMSKQFSPIKLKQRKAKFALVNSTAIKSFQKKNSQEDSNLINKKLFSTETKNLSNQNQFKQTEKQRQKSKTPSLIYFGHPNWNLVLNLMVGMRKSIKALYDIKTIKKQKQINFNEVHQFLLGNKVTHGQFFSEYYKFVQIAPTGFQRLRNSFGVSNIQYQRSVGPQMLLNHLLTGNLTTINQKCSAGKSGSFFYLTLDNKVFLKTIPKRQYDSFINILKDYYKHMIKNQNTLMVRIYGLYKLKVFIGKEKKQTIYFISMQNVFKDLAVKNQVFETKEGKLYKIKIKEVYDLKGSFYKRTGQEGGQMKDNNWIDKNKQLLLPKQEKQNFVIQIKADTKFLKAKNLIDYSLLTAIVQIIPVEKIQNQTKHKNIFRSFHGGILSNQPNIFYITSIIDYLTVFETAKNFQYIFKTTFLSKDVSCVPPKHYCQRFRNFTKEKIVRVCQIIQEEEQQS